MTMSERATTSAMISESAAGVPLVEAVGGIAVIVLAILGLANIAETYLVPIEAILFGAVLLMFGSTLVWEFTQIAAGGTAGPSGMSAVFLSGAAGIVLGVLALLGIHADVLTGAAVIVFGSAMVLSSNSAVQLQALRPRYAEGSVFSEMASGSAGVQALGGLTVIVLGILALSGINAAVLILVAFLVLGAMVVISGSALSGAMMTWMRRA